jgi:hypothetical protein
MEFLRLESTENRKAHSDANSMQWNLLLMQLLPLAMLLLLLVLNVVVASESYCLIRQWCANSARLVPSDPTLPGGSFSECRFRSGLRRCHHIETGRLCEILLRT